MSKRTSLMSKLMVFMLTLAVVFTYSVMPMSQAYAASAKPAKVTIKKATPVSTTSFKVTWKKAKSAKKYQVYVSTKKNKGFKKVATTSKTSYTVKKLNKKALKVGKKYYVKVRGINGKTTGKWSKVKAVTTLKKPSEIAPTLGESKTATMSTYIDMSKYDKGKEVKVWIPVPKSDEFQTISEPVFDAPKATEARLTDENENGNKMLYIYWGKDVEPKDRKASLLFTGTRVEVKRTGLKNNSKVAIPASAKKYINKESEYVKVKAPIVQEYALKATKGKTTTLGKARAIYDWTIANLERIDNNEELVNAKGEKKTFAVEGCGYGDTVKILTDLKTFGRAGGHCTDINSTFVALCRAAGIPAREMFGIRMNEDATGGQHCWAEFYLPGTGWVYADPADVLKAIRPKSGATVDEIKAAKASDTAKEKTAYFWGGVDNNRIVISRGRDVTFNPPQAWGKCNTFGYPAAEVDGQRIKDFTNAKEFVYKIDCIDYTKLEGTEKAEAWKKLGIEYKDLDLAKDFVIDVRTPENYATGHIVGSENFSVAAEFDKAKLKEVYDKAAGKRVVLVCNSGQSLARKAMQALKETGAYMPDVTYLIGGAKGMNEGDYKLNMGITKDNLDYANDIIIDVRPNTADYPDLTGVTDGHYFRSPVSGAITAEQSAALRKLYDEQKANGRIVIVCIKGHGLAKAAIGDLKAYDFEGLKNVTYLIGGASGL